MAMEGHVSCCCFLLAVILSSTVVRGSNSATNTVEFPMSTTVFPPSGADNRSEKEEMSSIDSSERAEMSRMMENHLLRMLKLSSRPPARVTESSVPGYIRALQHAVDTVPLSSTAVDADHLTWAVKAIQGIYYAVLVPGTVVCG